MLTDNLIPMLAPNQFIEMKSVNKLGSGRVSAVKLSVYFNYLHEHERIEYHKAANIHVQRFLTYLIYGSTNDLKIVKPENSLCHSTLQGYVSAITEFYKWLDHNYETSMRFYSHKQSANHSYLFGQIYTYDYRHIIKRLLPDIKGGRSYLKWYDESTIEKLCSNFLTLRDEAVFRLTLEGFRIDEVLSMRLAHYDSTVRLIQPSRSKLRQSVVEGYENRLRVVRISEETAHVVDRYIYEERTIAEDKSEIISDWIFINLRAGKNYGMPLAYHNYLAILKGCARRAGIDKTKIRTHSGRSTKVMDMLEEGVVDPAKKKSDIQMMLHFGWRSIDSIRPYMNHNSEIMANAAYNRHSKGENEHD
jgi:site-specific recombinase XerD